MKNKEWFLNRLEMLVEEFKEGERNKASFMGGLRWTVEKAREALRRGNLTFDEFSEIVHEAKFKAMKHAFERLLFSWTMEEVAEEVGAWDWMLIAEMHDEGERVYVDVDDVDHFGM